MNASAPAPPSPPPGWLRLCPGLAWLRGYRREWLAGDLAAGLTVCVVMVPSVIAYAGLLGIPPQYGLYAALIPLLVYPLFGTSRQVIVGPDIAICLLIAGVVGPLASGNETRAAALAGMLALLTGGVLLLGARARIGAVADFLSKPVLVGYMTGAALILAGSQLNKLFGVALTHNDFFPRLGELAGQLGRTHMPTLGLGAGLLVILAALRRWTPKLPPALAVCAAGGVAGWAFGLEGRGVAMVGNLPRGWPGWAWPRADWHEIQQLLPAAFSIAFLTYTEGILLARAFAAKHGYEVEGNRELVALGVADLAAGMFHGFAVTGSQARTAINDAAGGRTPLAGWVAAGALALFLSFLTPLIAHLPVVALAVVLIYGGSTLVEFDVMRRIYAHYPRSAAVAGLTTLGVLVAGVVPGILIGVGLSLLGLINRISHPPDAVLREVPGHGFHDLGAAALGAARPGLLVYRFYAPLLFSNAGHFVARVRELVAANPTPVVWFLLDAQAITDVDVTAAEALHDLQAELRARGIAFKIAHANRPLRAVLERTGLAEDLAAGNFYSSVHDCAAAFEARFAPTGGEG